MATAVSLPTLPEDPAPVAYTTAPTDGPRILTDAERRLAIALAEAVFPANALPGGGPATIDRLKRQLREMGPTFGRAWAGGLWAIEARTRATRARSFAALATDERERLLADWVDSESKHARWLLRGVLVPLKQAHFDDAGVVATLGLSFGRPHPTQDETPRWAAQVIDGRAATADMDVECDVVVVGSGAGGGATAYELARRGRAVLVVEAGDWHKRSEFVGRASQATPKMFLGHGTTFALGNVAAAVWAGRAVGGTTIINSGTCFRLPEWTLARWRERYGLAHMTSDALAPYYERVEAMLGVKLGAREHLGGVARTIARGADAMGLHHGPLPRNAPDCDGQGVCCFGCPTGAKRSTDVSYLPEALSRGAQLVTAADVLRVDVRDGRARGLTARLRSGKTLRVRAGAVVVAGGALMTPLLLRRSGICTSSGWLGKNLSIHPATKVYALFDETIDMHRGIPQSYGVDDLAPQGIMFEGASVPIDVASLGVPWIGRPFMELMADYRRLASFGIMLQDHARGSVRAGLGGLPLLRYDTTEGDLRRMQGAVAMLSEIFLRAGAKRVLPFVHGHDELRDEGDLDRLRRATLSPGDIEVTAYHPLGTCRMGIDPARSCVGPSGEAHDTAGVYVADGSALPSSLGVNPQMTIMAHALRTAEGIDERLDRRPRSAGPAARRPSALGFEETMRGVVTFQGETLERAISFTLDASSATLAEFARSREAGATGTIDIEGFATARPATGTLGIDLFGARRISYDLRFEDDAGALHRLVGHKSPTPLAPVRSMTVLPFEIEDADGEVVARGEATFDVAELPAFVASAVRRAS